MTTWIENPEGGRERGPRGLIRAWLEVLVRPGRFFRNGVSPGDQAPGLTFAIAVATVFTVGWTVVDPSVIPAISDSIIASAAVTLFIVGVLAAPVGLHLTAVTAVLSVILASLRRTDSGSIGLGDRGGVSETVQVIAYASAPFALAGPPIPAVRIACAVYATGLLVVGLRAVHDLSWARAAIAALPPALVGFWVGYRALASLRPLL